MTSGPSTPGGLHILVVDDEPDVRDSLEMMLCHFKHSVETAGNGTDALALFDKASFDIVITDYKMDGMTGDQLAREIKQRSPKTPVLMISAFAEDLQGSPHALDHVDRLLPKPYRMEELQKAIAQVTAQSKG